MPWYALYLNWSQDVLQCSCLWQIMPVWICCCFFLRADLTSCHSHTLSFHILASAELFSSLPSEISSDLSDEFVCVRVSSSVRCLCFFPCLEYSSEEELARNMKYFLQQLPQVNYSLLRFLCRFLSNVASLQEESWSIGALAAVFGPDIFQYVFRTYPEYFLLLPDLDGYKNSLFCYFKIKIVPSSSVSCI